jgi:hypothetical protein
MAPARKTQNRLNGAAQESNLPSVGLRRRTGFEDQLGHRPQPLRGGHYVLLLLWRDRIGGRADLKSDATKERCW